jgi:hypothetical protein
LATWQPPILLTVGIWAGDDMLWTAMRVWFGEYSEAI